jgi:hypothetical protein
VVRRSKDLDELSLQAQATFLKWKEGIAVKAIMIPSGRASKQRRTYFRHKAEILEVLGVNISKTVQEELGALEKVKYHGEYLIKRDSSAPQGFLSGLFQRVSG